ncbi:MAG TPA: cytochrome c biogenesis protein CcdA [Patescibacteria group bacterium]|jgi:cytochrome c biogenesis protein CcdA
MYQISLLAAYIAGMVALFAPCCISYLFPAYLGNIFKERKQVLLMTLIYSLGILVVMLPVVLGAKLLASVFFNLHDQTYLVGGLVMVAVAGLALLGLKLPMPHFTSRTSPANKPKNDVISTFTLGIFAGITSACCAPVLIGVMAISSLSPTLLVSLAVGMAYVLGMVTPLYLAALFIDKRNILERPIFRKKVTELVLFERTYAIHVSNLIAAGIFLLTGGVMLYLNAIGRLGMTTAEDTVAKSITNVALTVTDKIDNLPGVDLIFAVFAIVLLYKFIKGIFKKEH